MQRQIVIIYNKQQGGKAHFYDEKNGQIWSFSNAAWGDAGTVLTGMTYDANGNFAQYFLPEVYVKGKKGSGTNLNEVLVTMALNGIVSDAQGLKQYIAVVVGESSNNVFEAAAIGSVMINRINHVGASLTDGFIFEIGGAGQYNAIGEAIYNSIINSSWDEIFNPKNPYATRILGAFMPLFTNTDYSNGAYFWDASNPRIGFNWDAYFSGTFSITTSIGATTFFKYSDSNKIWP